MPTLGKLELMVKCLKALTSLGELSDMSSRLIVLLVELEPLAVYSNKHN